MRYLVVIEVLVMNNVCRVVKVLVIAVASGMVEKTSGKVTS